MSEMKIPSGYHYVMPYLILEKAGEFIEFAKEVLAATEKFRQNREDNPNVIGHCELAIGDSTIMLAEATEQWSVNTAGLFVYVKNVDESYAKALSLGATALMPPEDMPYGRSSGVRDPYGNVWWITSPI